MGACFARTRFVPGQRYPCIAYCTIRVYRIPRYLRSGEKAVEATLRRAYRAPRSSGGALGVSARSCAEEAGLRGPVPAACAPR